MAGMNKAEIKLDPKILEDIELTISRQGGKYEWTPDKEEILRKTANRCTFEAIARLLKRHFPDMQKVAPSTVKSKMIRMGLIKEK